MGRVAPKNTFLFVSFFFALAVSKKKRLRSFEKQKARLFEIPGLQLPDNLKQPDSTAIIHTFFSKVNPFYIIIKKILKTP